jgi:anhydro-N-acetylmuramic acid kinase
MQIKQTIKGIGIMSGSSLDGLDIALCSFEKTAQGWSWEIIAGETFEYDPSWIAKLSDWSNKSAYDLAKTHTDFGHLIGMKIRNFSIVHGKDYQFVASHGHTAFHQPERHFTCQIGDGETIATYLTCPLVTNFRNKDVALGGQGAPLVPMGESLLFPNVSLFLNLGGIANISILPRENDHFQVTSMRRDGGLYTAFDICPCNLVLNHLAERLGKSYDAEGKLAKSGNINAKWLNDLNNISFYHLFPPRSLGREWVEAEIFATMPADIPTEDLLCTFCHHIAYQIAQQAERFRLTDTNILITGGGAFNTFLMDQIREALAPYRIQVIPTDEKLIQYKEALIFAFLGLLTLQGQPTTLASVTGARHEVVSGSIHVPAYDTKHWQDLFSFFSQPIFSSN